LWGSERLGTVLARAARTATAQGVTIINGKDASSDQAAETSAFAERCERIRWRLQAEAMGFAKPEAGRLAFWRWLSSHRASGAGAPRQANGPTLAGAALEARLHADSLPAH
jgi:hypothetical protein